MPSPALPPDMSLTAEVTAFVSTHKNASVLAAVFLPLTVLAAILWCVWFRRLRRLEDGRTILRDATEGPSSGDHSSTTRRESDSYGVEIVSGRVDTKL